MNILFVLRGRPGLGHVIPGLAIAQQATSRGHRALVLTYGNGATFLSGSPGTDCQTISVPDEYSDWPGLSLYDHGLRVVAPIAEDFDADLIVLGGEYLLAPLQDIVSRPCLMLFNPEIMEDNDRNLLPTRLFLALFKHCQYLAPMQPLHADKYFAEFAPQRNHLLPEGPYVPFSKLIQKDEKDAGPCVLIANGGGISFPSSTQSYSSGAADSTCWIEETKQMTRKAVTTAIRCLDGQGRVVVFSCLGEEWNKQLLSELADEPGLEVSAPSMSFYNALAEADVVISRAGAGLITDVQTIDADVILWCLTGHDEQQTNAQRLCSTRGATVVAQDTQHLEELVVEILDRDVPRKMESSTTSVFLQNSSRLVQYLEQAMVA